MAIIAHFQFIIFKLFAMTVYKKRIFSKNSKITNEKSQ